MNIGDKVQKKRGSEWHGTIVGTYSTALTPRGYAVESEREQGSVQIYPEDALELVTYEVFSCSCAVEVASDLNWEEPRHTPQCRSHIKYPCDCCGAPLPKGEWCLCDCHDADFKGWVIPLEKGKVCCSCRHTPQEKPCEHGNESWDCTACIRKALTPQEKGEVKTKREELEDELREQLHVMLRVTSNLLPESDEEFIAVALPNLVLWAFEKVTAAEERGYLEGRDDEHVLKSQEAYQRGLADAERIIEAHFKGLLVIHNPLHTKYALIDKLHSLDASPL